jgi:hypothetical protein
MRALLGFPTTIPEVSVQTRKPLTIVRPVESRYHLTDGPTTLMVFYLTADALIAYHRNLANSPSAIGYGAFGFPEPEKFQTS